DPRSSGHHAELFAEGGRWWIVDRQSANGTWVNSERVERRALEPGDVVSFGGDQFVVSGMRRSVLWTIAAVTAIAAGVAVASYVARQRATLSPQEIGTLAARSVFAIVVEENGQRSILGTAFAVRADGMLATSAHVAERIGRRRA